MSRVRRETAAGLIQTYTATVVKPGLQNIMVRNERDVFGDTSRAFFGLLEDTPANNPSWFSERGTVPNSVPDIMCDKLLADTYFGENFPDRISAPTRIPTSPGLIYSRDLWALCDSFWRDLTASGPMIGNHKLKKHNNVNKDFDEIDLLFKFLDQDEAMMFVVSQLTCQGGIIPAITDLLMFRTRAHKDRMEANFALYIQNVATPRGNRDVFLHPGAGGSLRFSNTIKRVKSGTYIIESESALRLNPIQYAEWMPCPLADTDMYVGDAGWLTSAEARVSTCLRRYVDAIQMDLMGFNYKVGVRQVPPVRRRLPGILGRLFG